MRLDELALASAAAVVSTVVMLLLGVFGAIGVYEGAVEAMQQWHLFFEPTARLHLPPGPTSLSDRC